MEIVNGELIKLILITLNIFDLTKKCDIKAGMGRVLQQNKI